MGFNLLTTKNLESIRYANGKGCRARSLPLPPSLTISKLAVITTILNAQECYTDTHTLERDRGVSIKSMPMTFILQDTKSKSYSFNIINTPEHIYFVDEVTAALRLYDVAVSYSQYERIIWHVIQENLEVCQHAQGRDLHVFPERGSQMG
ncbi:P-loop containing nucleoside triphosphate hydrolase protein [Gigaspora margarita]|uniref:P-loop containing nucleoside triphosphate hydrolase protein n=1 Tax=Gigaspora margarita TaxID=4874 RepID=A0A8H3XKZ7_GIGMA|nr:P-loop containing nucleoside triphosphate hydrolase protein [Gigaspora margarita]